jgi:hypothetical protein
MTDADSLEIAVPEGTRVVASVDRNLARQLFMPNATGRFVRDPAGGRIEFAGHPTVPVVRSIKDVKEGEIALRLPRAILDDVGAIPRTEDFKWLGLPPAVEADEISRSYFGTFRFNEGSDDGSTPGLRAPQLGAIHAVLAH